MIVRQQRSVRLLSKKAFDVCVIGSGAAGIPFVRELAHSGLSILVLEAGDIDVSVSSQEFYKGEEDTQNMPPDYLSTMRLRALGGTTGHWTGEGLPLDDIDFAPREWIPYSGWPIGPSALAPYYKTAARYCGFPDDLGGDLALPPAESSAHRPLFGFRPLLTANPVPRFGTEYLKFLKSSRNVELCLSCPVIELHSDATQTKTASVVAVAGGERVTFTARNYVLAAGTVENARLLLNSLRLNRLTLGEEREVIGRFFMDHCEGIVGMLRTPDTSSITGLKSDVHPRLRYHYIPTLWLSAEAQRLMKVQNMAFVVQRYEVPQSAATRQSERDKAASQMEAISRLRSFFGDDKPPQGVYFTLAFRSEARPDPLNRVTLTGSLDGLGVPRVKLFYRWNQDDLRSVGIALQRLAGDFGLRYGAFVRRLAEAADVVGSSFHQIGTTRMGQTTATSVVDANCRVHSCANLYIAGSSVFPSAGWVNPTLTIVALAVRLADHLKRGAA